jgi:hypothetical protein
MKWSAKKKKTHICYVNKELFKGNLSVYFAIIILLILNVTFTNKRKYVYKWIVVKNSTYTKNPQLHGWQIS